MGPPTTEPVLKASIGETQVNCKCDYCNIRWKRKTYPIHGSKAMKLPGFSCTSSNLVWVPLPLYAQRV